MKRLLCSVLAFMAFAGSESSVFAQFKNTPFDTNTWKPPKIKVPPIKIPGGGGGGSTSGLSVVSAPYIDANGNVFSGTGSTSSQPRYVGKATRTYMGNLCYWTSSYSDIYGRPAQRRAPQYDRQEKLGQSVPGVPTGSNGGNIEIGSQPTMMTRNHIDAVTGRVIREVYRNGVLQSSTVIGAAQLQYSSDGRPYWVYGGQMAWANYPALLPYPPLQPQQQISNEQQIVNGVLQIIQGAIQNRRP
jgi:hypothetical protein